MSATLPSSTLCCEEEFCDSPITVSVPGPIGPIGPTGPAAEGGLVGVLVADTLVDARALPNLPTNRYLIMLGTDVVGNGYGAQFYWDNTSNDLDDYTDTGGSTIAPNFSSGSGRWKRLI